MTERAYKRDDRVTIIGPNKDGGMQYVGLEARVVNHTEDGYLWLHSLEEKWYIGFFPPESLKPLEMPQAPAPPSPPRCKTCKHFIDLPVIDPLICDHPDLAPDPEAGYQFEPPSPDFGCTLHEPVI